MSPLAIRGIAFQDLISSTGLPFHSRPSRRRPRRFLNTPPHCLKKKGMPSASIREYLESEGFRCAIRLPSNENPAHEIARLMTRPVGRPPETPIVLYHEFEYQAATNLRRTATHRHKKYGSGD